MIAQIWRGRTRADDSHDFTSLLQARLQAELAISKACQGGYLLQRQTEDGQAESLVLTLYDHRSARAERPEKAGLPHLSETEMRLLTGGDPIATRYQVILDPPRALLYAELRRRFPLRIAAPR